jgi:hypothetical protein
MSRILIVEDNIKLRKRIKEIFLSKFFGSSRVIVKKSKAIHFLRDKADLI